MKSFVRVEVTLPGIHNWPNAPARVGFLRYPHRHLFVLTLDVPVTHTDRDVEFFTLQEEIFHAFEKTFARDSLQQLQFGSRSCEMIAEWTLEQFPNAIRCTVSEDGENLGGAER